jgi:hypothetical protein
VVSSCFLKFWTLKLSINGIQAYVLTGQAAVVLMLNLHDTEKCCQVFHDDGDPHWEKKPPFDDDMTDVSLPPVEEPVVSFRLKPI